MAFDLDDFLPPERATAVDAWLKTPLRDCCICGDPIYPTDPRCLDPDTDLPTLIHLSCVAASE
jgi:hypothetical protein